MPHDAVELDCCLLLKLAEEQRESGARFLLPSYSNRMIVVEHAGQNKYYLQEFDEPDSEIIEKHADDIRPGPSRSFIKCSAIFSNLRIF